VIIGQEFNVTCGRCHAFAKIKRKKTLESGKFGDKLQNLFCFREGKKITSELSIYFDSEFSRSFEEKKNNVPQIFPHFILLETIGIASHA